MFEPRPAEELYDTEADPWELHNLAGDPAHAETLQRMRQALDEHLDAYDRYGAMDESAMKHQWWAGDIQPVTATPRAFCYNADSFGQAPLEDGQTIKAPALAKLHSPTQGASIVWTVDEADPPTHWNLSTEPLRFTEPGQYVLQASAHRIGFLPSETARLRLTVE
jgi:arylsulfatase A-like enzyme